MKKYTSKRSVQLLAHLLKEYGILDVIISPGSRNGPLAIQFGEMDAYNSYSIVDERSAAFVALGMAKSTEKPVALTCTSGSAVANYYPAVIEAFYSNIPLLMLTADRPTNLRDLFDGQTIRQKDFYKQHCYGDFELKEDQEDHAEDYNFNTIKTAIELCIEKQGPVHINIPLKEPLYDLISELPKLPKPEYVVPEKKFEMPPNFLSDWNASKKILILTGTLNFSAELETQLSQLVKNHTSVVLSEANSNLYHEKFFRHIDRYVYNFDEEDFKTYAPDLLITIGQNVVSKKVKQFLRKAKPAKHWHIDPFWHPDTYFALTEKIVSKPEVLFNKLLNVLELKPSAYFTLWNDLREKKDAKHQEFLKRVDFSDFGLYLKLSEKIPEQYNIHFANSSAIRYAQLFDFKKNKIYCNRGTSGIDGSTSTAMGFAIKNPNPTVLITGDLSFFYDINGLWNQYIPPHARIIICNDGDGDIFKFIPGPSNANDNILDEFIATKHNLNAESIAKHFKMGYFRVEDDLTLDRSLDKFFTPESTVKILEINTRNIENADVLKSYFEFLK